MMCSRGTVVNGFPDILRTHKSRLFEPFSDLLYRLVVICANELGFTLDELLVQPVRRIATPSCGIFHRNLAVRHHGKFSPSPANLNNCELFYRCLATLWGKFQCSFPFSGPSLR